jgi:hypothetical protein
VKARRARFNLKQDLMDKEEGMTALYTTFVGTGERPAKGKEVFPMKGKGNELRDFNRIMTAVKGW